MKRMMIVIVFAFVFICGSVIVYLSNGGNPGNQASEVEEAGMVSPTNGEQMPSPSPTEKERMLSQEEIVQLFNDNYDVFAQVMEYIENHAKSTFDCDSKTENIDITIDGEHFDINEIEVGEQFAYIINDLGYKMISGDTGTVAFYRQFGIFNGGGYEQGLMRNRANAEEWRIISEWDGDPFGRNVHVQNGWYYYYRWNSV